MSNWASALAERSALSMFEVLNSVSMTEMQRTEAKCGNDGGQEGRDRREGAVCREVDDASDVHLQKKSAVTTTSIDYVISYPPVRECRDDVLWVPMSAKGESSSSGRTLL